jgi:hypothetical protein
MLTTNYVLGVSEEEVDIAPLMAQSKDSSENDGECREECFSE